MSLQLLLGVPSPYAKPELPVIDRMVREGETRVSVTLPHMLHGFLVGCVREHLYDVEIFHDSIALNLLAGASEKRREQANVLLMRAGDEALLIAGLFPGSARRLNVSPSYFRSVGQTAYASISTKSAAPGVTQGSFFDTVAEAFPILEKILRATRWNYNEELAWEAFLRFKASL